MSALTSEMVVQGMPWPDGRLPAAGEDGLVEADEVEQVVAAARETPLTLADGQLWVDWLTFLEGAAQNGGLLIRA